ncbi:MAG: formylglycine-generating enzyme family protein, partial [Oscillochloridaceae bacterium umkhey_bin13]
AYCNWLTQLGHAHGWLPPDQEIRMPTSLEWERAARHIDQRPYPWGDAQPTANHANYEATGLGAPSPVGCFSAGRAVCEAEDLVGNVLEWLATADEDRTNLATFKPQKDFTPNDSVLLSFTYYNDELDQLCCGARYGSDPFYWFDFLGFRVLQSLRAH